MRTAPVALVAVGLLLLAGGGWLQLDIRECRETRTVVVSPDYAGPAYDVANYSSLSDHQRRVFRRALNGSGHVETERGLELPGGVRYRGETYSVGTAHADDCGRPVGQFLVWGAWGGSAAAIAAGARRIRRTGGI